MLLGAVLLAALIVRNAYTKIYDRCELARELVDVHEISEKQLPTWLCIAYHESNFNTSALNVYSGDHGLFQISQLYWCSPPGSGYACGLPCSALRDENIEDDVVCARRIFRQHKLLTGDGFNAWVVYSSWCKDPAYVPQFVHGCFDTEESTRKIKTQNLPLKHFANKESPISVGHVHFPWIIYNHHSKFALVVTSKGFSFRSE